ncbi:hypothetical protein BJ875DRAFT_502908 [Amylocarpus encephaloides]|uniref:Alpha-1,2-mannosyltransferase n=1 Tax=Amylocarpus encephaloides TaxID=45428 RepID=A0A9P7YPZ0_9HELO|nr:hypothetical protein BJ875DRAFT_502908 [Amylocarpus encephaloides]
MVPFSIFTSHWALGLGAFFLLSSVYMLAVRKRQRGSVLERFRFPRRRASGASTPPRSISPGTPKETKGCLSSTASSGPDYLNTFPPSCRSALPKLAKSATGENKRILKAANAPPKDLVKEALPMLSPYSESRSRKYTPTGLSTDELRAIGDFPAYDVLSGVPLPSPYKTFDPVKALPRPYRPFRWNYHQTMSFTKMETDWWLEIDNSYVSIIKKRQALFREYGNKVLDFMPGSELVCKELMEMCLQFYCARYPTYFSLSADKKIFHNNLLKTETDIKSIPPLHVLLDNVPEDFAIVLRNEKDGMYYMRAGVICSSLGWNVSTKIGLQLRDIHSPIPDYKEKMQFSMDRYFSKMPTHAPIQRGSWGLEVGTPLFMPPGDPHEKLRESQDEDLQLADCNLRVDWQTLRRLPLSGGIVFNFTALFTPVVEFRDEPYVPALLLKILKEGKKSLMEYKNTWHVEHVVVPALEAYAREQVEKGLVTPEHEGDEAWSERTLDESPYFPGWEQKWHRQQGY